MKKDMDILQTIMTSTISAEFIG